MSGSLNDVSNESLRNLLGNRSFTLGILGIDGTNTENVETQATVQYCINGVLTLNAAITEIDLSAKKPVAQDGTEGVAGAFAALPDGKSGIYMLVFNGTSNYVGVVVGDYVTTGSAVPYPSTPPGWCPFGAIKVDNASGSNFVLGTTALDASGITDTYYNLSVSPADVTL